MNTDNLSKRSSEEITSLISEWEQSKLSKKKFCGVRGINYQTFIGWMIRRRDKNKSGEKKFIPIHVQQPASSIFAEIHLSASKKIILHQPVSGDFIQSLLKC